MRTVAPHIVGWLKKNGKLYTPALCPDDIKRGDVGTCFDTSTVQAIDGKYTYVEGIALHPVTGEWILHAWLTDDSGKLAYDPTWQAFDKGAVEIPVPTKYVGVAVEMESLVHFMLETRYASIFANGWRYPELADLAIPGVPIYKP